MYVTVDFSSCDMSSAIQLILDFSHVKSITDGVLMEERDGNKIESTCWSFEFSRHARISRPAIPSSAWCLINPRAIAKILVKL